MKKFLLAILFWYTTKIEMRHTKNMKNLNILM